VGYRWLIGGITAFEYTGEHRPVIKYQYRFTGKFRFSAQMLQNTGCISSLGVCWETFAEKERCWGGAK
jgi:hypothetical protein